MRALVSHNFPQLECSCTPGRKPLTPLEFPDDEDMMKILMTLTIIIDADNHLIKR